MKSEDDLDLLHMLAFFYWRRQQTGRAAALAYAAYRLGRRDGKLLCLLASSLLKLGFPDRCLAILDEIDISAHAELGRSSGGVRARAWLQLGDLDRAKEAFAQVVDGPASHPHDRRPEA